jgi:hypothetical protein
MKAFWIFVAGVILFGATFAGWVFLNAFGCGMNPTGCGGFSLNWSDFEALRLFLPTFVIGAGLMIWGLLLWWQR